MKNLRYVEANTLFKYLRDHKLLHESLGRKSATRALVNVLALDSEGDNALVDKDGVSVIHDELIHIPPLLDHGKTYNLRYLAEVAIVLRYLRGGPYWSGYGYTRPTPHTHTLKD